MKPRHLVGWLLMLLAVGCAQQPAARPPRITDRVIIQTIQPSDWQPAMPRLRVSPRTPHTPPSLPFRSLDDAVQTHIQLAIRLNAATDPDERASLQRLIAAIERLYATEYATQIATSFPTQSAGVPRTDFTILPTSSSSTTTSLPALDMSKPVSVRGYYRKDGTYVRPHTRNYPQR